MARMLDTSTQGLRALILDPDDASVRSLAWALETRFFSVCTAPDGTRGLERLLDELLSLDVLVIDAALPDRDALAFAELIRRAGGEQDLAIVVVAATPASAPNASLLAAGVDAVVDRREGPDAVALAAVAAVASHAGRSIDVDAPPADAERPLGLESHRARFALPFGSQWSMLPA